MSITRLALLLAAAGAALSAVPVGTTTSAVGTTTLDVPGRSDSTPWIAARDAFVAVAWGAAADGKADVFVATSQDGGRTFGAPVRVNRIDGEGRLGGELPPRVAIHPTTPGTAPTIDVLWNARGTTTEIKIARSSDGGRSFDAPVSLQAPGAAGDRGWPALAVDAQGGAHAIWLDHRGLAARRTGSSSSRTSTTSGAARHVHADGPPVDGAVMAQESAVYHAATVGTNGAQGDSERAISPGVCYCCKTALAAGADGLLVAAWRHVYPGDLRDIAFSISRDNGRTFAPPARVSEDGWAINGCPDDGPSVVVDAKGTTHIVWPTVIGGDAPQGALFYSSTTDGQRFTTRVRIPTMGGLKPAHPQIAIGPSGRLVVAWDDNVDGRRVAALREITPAGDAPRFGNAVTITSGGSDNHPVIAVAADAVIAAWASGGDDSRVVTRRLQLP